MTAEHREAVTEACRTIRELWPEASVALSGSLGRDDATFASDVDLLLAVPGAPASRHGWWPGANVPFSFVVVAVPARESTLRDWGARFNCTLLNYVADSTPLHDPHGYVQRLIETTRWFREELSRRGEQVEIVRLMIQASADHAKLEANDSGLRRLALRSAAYQAGVTLWHLIRGTFPRDKAATLASVAFIRRDDPVYEEALSRLLRCDWSEFPVAIADLSGLD